MQTSYGLLRRFAPRKDIVGLSARPLLCLLWAVSLPALAVDTQYLQSISDSEYHRVESEIIGRAYHVFVNLPESYEQGTDASYPTVYLLDGGMLFPLFSAYSRYLTLGEEVPDAIMVGISYGGSTFEEGNFRSSDFTAPSAERDYWGGAADFQAFLKNELVPFIENNYRSNPGRRIIFGQSLGGQFVLFTALTTPELFWGHIASNPALHRNLPFFLEYEQQESGAVTSKLFVGSGTLDDPQFRDPAVQWIRYWRAREDKPWLLEAADLEGHSHMSAPPASFRAGMRWLFSE